MSRCHNDYILAEKTMNTLSNVEKSSKVTPTTTKRAPLTKAFSCSDASPSNSGGPYAFITPRQFVELVYQSSDSQALPILDCRSQIDYGCERIRSSHNINCRAKIMARKLTSKRLEDVEPNLTSSLSNSDTVILYDQSTDVRGEEKLNTLPINLVVQAAQKSNKKVQIIQGGLDAVKTEYPHLIECPADLFNSKLEQDLVAPPASPDAIDKENVMMTKIEPQIYVGNAFDSQNRDRLSKNGITHIINCTPDLPCCYEHEYEYLRIDALDAPSQNIRKYFDAAIDFIGQFSLLVLYLSLEDLYENLEKALRSKTNNVLVHCSAGISRSPTLVLAYMMKKYRWTLEQAFDKMRKLRQIVDPNVSFIIQLREWEKSIMSNITPTASATDMNDENLTTVNSSSARLAPSTAAAYCGSTSKNKTDTKTCTDSAIIVN